jgi:hypothetical protein
MLPVKQIGSILFSNQINEELPHGYETDNDSLGKAFFKNDFLSTHDLTLNTSLILPSPKHLHTADVIPQNHAGDIHVPPPNC